MIRVRPLATAVLALTVMCFAVERHEKTAPCAATQAKSTRAFPSADLGCGQRVSFVGLYSSDGKFQPNSWRLRMQDSQATEETDKSKEIPGSIDRRARTDVVENVEPPHHVQQSVEPSGRLSTLRDGLVAWAYGREKVLSSPAFLIGDSTGRLIVTDDDSDSVTVLDGKNAFQILGGPGRRFQTADAVAIDAQDNLYVLDSKRAIITVLDREGHFLRYLGKREDESLFESPGALAIDREHGFLYVADTPRHLIFQLDLQGNVLRRIGAERSGLVTRKHAEVDAPQKPEAEKGFEFDAPTDVIVGGNTIVVLDSAGSRIQLFDPQFRRLSELQVEKDAPTVDGSLALAVDARGNIYVSANRGHSVKIFDRSGVARGTLGQRGSKLGEFNALEAVWVDSNDRIYIADSGNHRIQVFQLDFAEAKPASATSSGK